MAWAISSGSFGRKLLYRQLSGSRRKWVAAKSIGFYVGKYRVLAGIVRRVARISGYLKRRVVRMVRERKSNQQVLASYDAYSYSQNFDDGLWKKEDEDFYRTHSFSSRFVALPIQTSIGS
ncbi:hypothetical protein MRB53_017534 [Persea americana]|uniref:Uncharacterized protein n=1 Tax=Persea americana TaxID=3435 RepID=A0ACC2M5B4_PERAE|nr:hypothetical protein MRB53_017534 [Persea americana]